MALKYIVVQGATCKCTFGKTPDKLKVLTNTKNFANDPEGKSKPIASTKDIGAATFEKNSFGSCGKMNNGPCKPNITKWDGAYEKATLNNGGNPLLEDSKATCAVGGAPCIEITDHGQISQPSKQNFKNADPALHSQINPLVDIAAMYKKQLMHKGVKIGAIT